MNRLMLKIDEDELKDAIQRGEFASAPAPVAVIMITLNEAHNLEAVLENLIRLGPRAIHRRQLLDRSDGRDCVETRRPHRAAIVPRVRRSMEFRA